jgi:hypothetical protein
MNKKSNRMEKINLLKEIMAGEKSFRELCEEKIYLVREIAPELFCENNGKEWSNPEIESHKLSNPTHSFFCYSTLLQEETFYITNIGIHSKTGTLKF